MVPDAEISLLVQIAEQVVDLAEAGARDEANGHLTAALRRARRLQRIGLPWGAELVNRYEFALAQFLLRYGKASIRPPQVVVSSPSVRGPVH